MQCLKIQYRNDLFGDSGPYDSLTSLCQRADCMVGCCENQGTLLSMTYIYSSSRSRTVLLLSNIGRQGLAKPSQVIGFILASSVIFFLLLFFFGGGGTKKYQALL